MLRFAQDTCITYPDSSSRRRKTHNSRDAFKLIRRAINAILFSIHARFLEHKFRRWNEVISCGRVRKCTDGGASEIPMCKITAWLFPNVRSDRTYAFLSLSDQRKELSRVSARKGFYQCRICTSCACALLCPTWMIWSGRKEASGNGASSFDDYSHLSCDAENRN